jgi:alginate O-acetyltransferase complex protein AlgJ
VVPAPVKPMVNPEMLWTPARGPVANASFARFKAELAGRGVLVFDPLDAGGRFLARDTHWRPETMEAAAARLAEFVKSHVELPQSLGVEYRREERVVRGRGDLAGMFASPSPLEEVTISSVIEPGGQLWAPRADAEILWLGDSFSNVYSAEEMAWGAAAGFAEQFSYYLSRPTDAIRRNDDGAFATRQMLADELAAGRDRLAGKKLVVWQFAARELSFGDWRLIEMRLGERPAAAQRQWVVPPIGEAWILSGVVLAKGAAPRPGNVAYRDHILAVHLGDLSIEGKAISSGEAVVYLRSMIDGKLTEAASLRLGQRVRLRVRDWSEVSRRYEFVNRSDLADAELRGQAACWGEILR